MRQKKDANNFRFQGNTLIIMLTIENEVKIAIIPSYDSDRLLAVQETNSKSLRYLKWKALQKIDHK
jgi:hypothetical protein